MDRYQSPVKKKISYQETGEFGVTAGYLGTHKRDSSGIELPKAGLWLYWKHLDILSEKGRYEFQWQYAGQKDS